MKHKDVVEIRAGQASDVTVADESTTGTSYWGGGFSPHRWLL